MLQTWDGDELLKTVLRTNNGNGHGNGNGPRRTSSGDDPLADCMPDSDECH